MNAAEKIAHAAERKAFEAMLDSLIRKSQTKDVCTVANDFVNMVQKIHSSVWTPETFEMLHQIANDPDSKWAHYAERLLRECDPYLLRTFLTAAAYEGGFRGFQQARANSEKYDCNIPWIVLMDPTSACNMRCAGCWAAEYGHKQNLTFEEMDRVLTEGAELGTHACLFTGGEPLMRKADIFRLCEKHRDIAFHAFTNGTLIDQAFCDELKRVGNFIVSVSIEGFEDANDGRRGTGHFEKALAAMDLMHKNHIPFGVSICYTSKNYKVVTSDEFLDLLISKGCFFAWYFHYMPIGDGANVNLMLNAEQREYMIHRVREIRGYTGGKPIFCIDFQNDGEYIDGCIAGGRQYAHINPAGDVEPCVFIHYSNANIHDKSLLDVGCLRRTRNERSESGSRHFDACVSLVHIIDDAAFGQHNDEILAYEAHRLLLHRLRNPHTSVLCHTYLTSHHTNIGAVKSLRICHGVGIERSYTHLRQTGSHNLGIGISLTYDVVKTVARCCLHHIGTHSLTHLDELGYGVIVSDALNIVGRHIVLLARIAAEFLQKFFFIITHQNSTLIIKHSTFNT